MTHPTTSRANQRIANLALIAATPHQPNCDAPTVALDLLIDHVGPVEAARYLTEAHAVLLAEQGA
ncbi:hypothetical protein [Nonomuraea sp. NPDC049141]|uniref:hypothetical protein n=1 Tax=Nonomuraea sp. NPDC049141 TaxID=3155500 RepID=UPI0033D21492